MFAVTPEKEQRSSRIEIEFSPGRDGEGPGEAIHVVQDEQDRLILIISMI